MSECKPDDDQIMQALLTDVVALEKWHDKKIKLSWLDEQEFYEVCQLYRHSKDYDLRVGEVPTVQAFEILKNFIMTKVQFDSRLMKEPEQAMRRLEEYKRRMDK